MHGNKNCHDIGIDRSKKFDKNNRNLPTNLSKKVAITEWITKGITDKKNIFGPFNNLSELKGDIDCSSNVTLAPIGAVPKEYNTGGNIIKYRPIVHMSAPRGGTSVNSAIFEHMEKVEYIKFLEIVEWVYYLGQGSWIWTADAQDAYLRVPVNEDSWKCMGFMWFGMLFIICSLPFGLASASQIYTTFADAVLWIIVFKCHDLFWTKNGSNRRSTVCVSVLDK